MADLRSLVTKIIQTPCPSRAKSWFARLPGVNPVRGKIDDPDREQTSASECHRSPCFARERRCRENTAAAIAPRTKGEGERAGEENYHVGRACGGYGCNPGCRPRKGHELDQRRVGGFQQTLQKLRSATGLEIGALADASHADVEAAIRAAVRAFAESDWKDNRHL